MEEALSTIGFGWFQVPSIATVLLIQGSYATQHIATLFTDMPRDFKCYTSAEDEDNSTSFNNLCSINITSDSFIMNTKEYLCTEFVYDNTDFETTFSSEFNLVCDKAWLSGIFKTAGFAGVIIGCIISGIGDKFGRASVIKSFSYLYLLNVLIVGFVPDLYTVIISRFLLGFCYETLNSSSYTLMMEVLPISHRSTVGAIVSNVAYTLFVIITGSVSYFIRSWRILHLTLSFPIYFLSVCILFIHKSPRWLVNNGNVQEGIDVLKQGAKMNNVQLSDELLDKIQTSYEMSTKELKQDSQVKPCQTCYSFTALLNMLFSTSKMRTIILAYPIIWFLIAIIYFSIPLNANNFTNNPFLYLVVMALADIPPNIFIPILVTYIGNVKTISIMFIIAMIGLLSAVFVPEHLIWLRWSVILLAMMSISSCYMIGYILGSELFPTSVRSVGFGMGSFARHTGVLTIQYLIDTASLVKLLWLPNAVAAGCCLIAGSVSATLLPETHGHPLCDTVEEVETRMKGSIENKTSSQSCLNKKHFS